MPDSIPAGTDPLGELAAVNAQLDRIGCPPLWTVNEAAALWPPDDIPGLVELSRQHYRAVVWQLRGML